MGAKVVTYLGSLIQWCCGDGGALQTNIPGMCSQCPGRTGFAPAHGVCAFPVYTAQAPGCSECNCLRRALGCVRFPGLSHSGSGSQVLHKGADLVGPTFCALSKCKQLSGPGAWQAHSPQAADLWLRPSQGMSTVQDPRKTWLATGSLLAVW